MEFLFKNIFFVAPLLCLSKGSVGAERGFKPIQRWPKYDNFGQISAVGVDGAGNVYVFHRGDRKWDATAFDGNDFRDRENGPIPNETIIVLDPSDGTVQKKTGTNLFYLPHGLSVDADNNVWVTDVALHQVFKFPPIDFPKVEGRLRKANLTLGVPFEHGNDNKHFCKPTGVAVDRQTKEFYVSDGYCNARIVKFDQFGNLLLNFGRTSIGAPQDNFYMFNVPHAVALAQERQILYVADRENLRVLSYDSQIGQFKKGFAEDLKSRIFSVAYSPLKGGLLFVLSNSNQSPNSVSIYSPNSGKLLKSFFAGGNFTNPHDLAVGPHGQYCYVVELNPYKIWKFELDLDLISQAVHSSEESDTATDRISEPIPAESKIDNSSKFEGSSSFLAAGLVFSVVAISFLIFSYHYYKRKGGYQSYESRRLILDEDDGGIRLT